jgi:hypothetical protein
MSYRYYDYPMPGSIYRLPDIPMLVRGKTYVKLPSGRDIEVDPEFKRDEPVPAAAHEQGQAGNALQDLLKQMTGKRTEGPPPGFKAGGLFDHNTQTPMLHAHEGQACCTQRAELWVLEEPPFGAVDEKGEPLPHWLQITRCPRNFVKER